MPETVWYYARGEVERGPFTTVQIKALANAGKLRSDDLVWKEGMENWTSAADVPELFADRAADQKATSIPFPTDPAVVRNPLLERAHRKATEFERVVTVTCRASVLIGLLCVVFVNGCESLSERRIASMLAADAQTALPGTVESAASRSPEILRARVELNSGSFGRGITLYGGILFLIVGGGGLACFANANDRWLGIAILSAVCLGLLISAEM